jgi:alkylation response protein AidB-like acyl-CoA dehydrogenase
MVIEHGGSEAQRSRWLPQLARGEIIATLAHIEPSGAWRPHDTSVIRTNGRLSGAKSFVWAAPTAHLLLVPFRDATTDAPIRIGLVDASASGVEITPEIGLDRTRRSGHVVLRDVVLTDDAILPLLADAIFAHLMPRACAALAAEMAGGADALLTMTAAYAATRVQFGRAIGSFQAVKHPLVNVLVGVEHLRSLVYAAASALDVGDAEAELLARMAKACASDLYGFAASRAVQLHGGFGFTIDCDAHFYMKRALASRPAFGDAMQHRRWIGERLVEGC